MDGGGSVIGVGEMECRGEAVGGDKVTAHTRGQGNRQGWDPREVNRLLGLVVKASASRAANPELYSRLRCGGRLIPVTKTNGTPMLPRKSPGVLGSALGLVGPVSVYCNWVR